MLGAGYRRTHGQAREKAEKRRKGEKREGSPERSCQLKLGASVMETHQQAGAPSWAHVPDGPIHSSSSSALEPGHIQTQGLAALLAAERRLHRGMSPVSAPRPAVPRHPGLAGTATSGQLSLTCICSCLWHPGEPSLGPSLIVHPSFTLIFHVWTSVDGEGRTHWH